MDYVLCIVIGLMFGGWILAVIGNIRSDAIVGGKLDTILIDELNNNRYYDVADSIQALVDCTKFYGIFTKRSKLYGITKKLFLKLKISPEKTKLYSYQRSFKIFLFLNRLGIVIFCAPFFLIVILTIVYLISNLFSVF